MIKAIIDYSHHLTNPDKKYKLRLHRKLLLVHMKVVNLMEKIGLNPSQPFKFLLHEDSLDMLGYELIIYVLRE